MLKYSPSMLAKLGGPVDLNQYWAHSILRHMKFMQRKATTSKSKHSVITFSLVKDAFLDYVIQTYFFRMEDISVELTLNWNPTGIKLVRYSSWTMVK